jgi:SSS family solute:Na+ symporter
VSIAIVIIFLTALAALLLGLYARRGHDMNLEEWSVGGRSFGTMLVFILLAGEIYTTFSFLGASGFTYGKGGAAYYILAYLTLNQVAGYWILPGIWRAAQRDRLVSQAHFFVRQYDSPALGVLVASVGLIALLFYFVLQLKGWGSSSASPHTAPYRRRCRCGPEPPSSPPMSWFRACAARSGSP